MNIRFNEEDEALMKNQIVPESKRDANHIGRFGRPPLDQLYDTRKETKVTRLSPNAKDKKK